MEPRVGVFTVAEITVEVSRLAKKIEEAVAIVENVRTHPHKADGVVGEDSIAAAAQAINISM